MDEKKVLISDIHNSVTVKSSKSILEAELFDYGALFIRSPATVSIKIERIGPTYDSEKVPSGTVYRIESYVSDSGIRKKIDVAYIDINGRISRKGEKKGEGIRLFR